MKVDDIKVNRSAAEQSSSAAHILSVFPESYLSL